MMSSGFIKTKGCGPHEEMLISGILGAPGGCNFRKIKCRLFLSYFGGLGGGRGVCAGVRGGVQFEGVVRKNRSVPSLRQFTAQPISCGDLAYSFVFVFSSCCFPSQAFPFVVLENEKNAISPSSPL